MDDRKKDNIMPNECINILKVRGKSDQLKTFYSENSNGDKDLLFSLSVPTNETKKNYWYKRNLYWSTKCEPVNVSSVKYHNDNTLIYEFLTAWSPPISWLLSISEKYANLDFFIKWEEPANRIKGSINAKNGIIIKCRRLVNENFPTKKISEILEKLEKSNGHTELQKEFVNYEQEKIRNAKNKLTKLYYIQDFIFCSLIFGLDILS